MSKLVDKEKLEDWLWDMVDYANDIKLYCEVLERQLGLDFAYTKQETIAVKKTLKALIEKLEAGEFDAKPKQVSAEAIRKKKHKEGIK